MIDLNKIVRPNVLSLAPYSSARDEFAGKEGVFLDANENPFGTLNRYPDPHQFLLKQKLAKLKQVATNQIFVGNGSDEVIDLAFRIFCNPGTDKALMFTPTYGMYEVSAGINNVELIKIPLSNNFQIDLTLAKDHLQDPRLKLIFICSPNNPTANLLNKNDIAYIIQNFKGMVVIDEAYIDFNDAESMIEFISSNNNLIISQTLSKAWGLAGARIGLAYAHREVIALFDKVKPPYNISVLNQKAALEALENHQIFKENISILLSEKTRMESALQSIKLVKHIYPSDANFLLIEVADADWTYKELVQQKIITRNRNKQISNTIRISIGTPSENDKLINALKNMS